MIEVPADHYLDAYGAAGVNVLLLTYDDELSTEALTCARRIENLIDYMTLWHVRIRNSADAQAVECCRVPQYRFIVDGNERAAHVGVLEDEDLIEKLGEL